MALFYHSYVHILIFSPTGLFKRLKVMVFRNKFTNKEYLHCKSKKKFGTQNPIDGILSPIYGISKSRLWDSESRLCDSWLSPVYRILNPIYGT